MRRCTLAALAALGLASAAHADDKTGTQQEKRSEKAMLNYLLHLPPGYEKAAKPFPLILFLHGAGERGDDLAKVKKHGPPKIVATKKDFPSSWCRRRPPPAAAGGRTGCWRCSMTWRRNIRWTRTVSI